MSPPFQVGDQMPRLAESSASPTRDTWRGRERKCRGPKVSLRSHSFGYNANPPIKFLSAPTKPAISWRTGRLSVENGWQTTTSTIWTARMVRQTKGRVQEGPIGRRDVRLRRLRIKLRRRRESKGVGQVSCEEAVTRLNDTFMKLELQSCKVGQIDGTLR